MWSSWLLALLLLAAPSLFAQQPLEEPGTCWDNIHITPTDIQWETRLCIPGGERIGAVQKHRLAFGLWVLDSPGRFQLSDKQVMIVAPWILFHINGLTLHLVCISGDHRIDNCGLDPEIPPPSQEQIKGRSIIDKGRS